MVCFSFTASGVSAPRLAWEGWNHLKNPLQRCSLTRLAGCLLSVRGPHRAPERAPNGAPGEVTQEAMSQADVSFLWPSFRSHTASLMPHYLHSKWVTQSGLTFRGSGQNLCQRISGHIFKTTALPLSQSLNSSGWDGWEEDKKSIIKEDNKMECVKESLLGEEATVPRVAGGPLVTVTFWAET